MREFTIVPAEAIRGYVFRNKYGTERFYYWVGEIPEGERQSFSSLQQAFSFDWAALTEILLHSPLTLPCSNSGDSIVGH